MRQGVELAQADIENQELQHLLGQGLFAIQVRAGKVVHRLLVELALGECGEPAAQTRQSMCEIVMQPMR